MKKLSLLIAMLVLAAATTSNVYGACAAKNPFGPNLTNPLAKTLLIATPVGTEIGITTPAPAGYTRVIFKSTSESRGKFLWTNIYGSLENNGGYSLAKARTISGIYKTADLEAGMEPCTCVIGEENTWKYYTICPGAPPTDPNNGPCCLEGCDS